MNPEQFQQAQALAKEWKATCRQREQPALGMGNPAPASWPSCVNETNDHLQVARNQLLAGGVPYTQGAASGAARFIADFEQQVSHDKNRFITLYFLLENL
jgi:hypothetical protein